MRIVVMPEHYCRATGSYIYPLRERIYSQEENPTFLRLSIVSINQSCLEDEHYSCLLWNNKVTPARSIAIKTNMTGKDVIFNLLMNESTQRVVINKRQKQRFVSVSPGCYDFLEVQFEEMEDSLRFGFMLHFDIL